ncbi:LysR family transcriptional regulator [Shinella sp. CPCC 101442]|uniref:LysR family transcriptional regulator n=1 Tax=Shinella sp. CPCC 101442 TaxID=2932265 RepID=UPI0021523B64|nr:LysR family transcriptional regulator [Shinella sp. CPCC 101442]MCR6501324.1 LysR family transcriptional regulator [Shinella sp. CPCC 101442]
MTTGLDDMRCLVEVIDTGGLNRAAIRLGLSKSIVSRRIAAIEEDLGVQLLTRTTRGIVPTEAGLEFRRRCDRILAEVAEARDVVSGKGGDLGGRLRVAAPQVLGQRYVAPVLGRLARDYPRLEIDVAFSDRVVDMVGEGFDLAVRIGEPREASLIGRKIAPVRAMLVASPAYLNQNGRPSTLAELGGHECLVYSGGGDWQFRQGRRWVSVRPSGRLRTDSGDTIVHWAATGLGIGNVPSFLVDEALASGLLEEVLPEFAQPEYGIYALRPPGSYVPAKVRMLIDALVVEIGSCSRPN